MLKEIELNLEDTSKLYNITKALASEIRIEILKLLNLNSLNVNEIAEKLNIPASTAAVNVKILEDSGLVLTELQPGVRGSMKLCSRQYDSITVKLHNPGGVSLQNSTFINMPIGNYIDCKVEPTCGIVSEKVNIGVDNDPSVFYNPDRIKAQLIWLCNGYLEYRFPNTALLNGTPKLIEISCELCSEAPYYRNNWPSDITVWINGIAIGTWTSPGDLGGRRGRLNPQWWPDTVSQYGILKTWRVDHTGSFIDEEKAAVTTIDSLNLKGNGFISVKIGVKEDAKNKGGLNIFGEQFGDHPQNIVMRLDYTL